MTFWYQIKMQAMDIVCLCLRSILNFKAVMFPWLLCMQSGAACAMKHCVAPGAMLTRGHYTSKVNELTTYK
jgi:hypothetical protein